MSNSSITNNIQTVTGIDDVTGAANSNSKITQGNTNFGEICQAGSVNMTNATEEAQMHSVSSFSNFLDKVGKIFGPLFDAIKNTKAFKNAKAFVVDVKKLTSQLISDLKMKDVKKIFDGIKNFFKGLLDSIKRNVSEKIVSDIEKLLKDVFSLNIDAAKVDLANLAKDTIAGLMNLVKDFASSIIGLPQVQAEA